MPSWVGMVPLKISIEKFIFKAGMVVVKGARI